MSIIKAELEATKNMVAMEKIKVIRPKSNIFGKGLKKIFISIGFSRITIMKKKKIRVQQHLLRQRF